MHNDDSVIYENWFALAYRGQPDQCVLVIERFNASGQPFDSDVMTGPRPLWEIEGDAVMKNRKAIAQGIHISCWQLREDLAAHAAQKERKPNDSASAIPWAIQRRRA